jgi:hypothetical protein
MGKMGKNSSNLNRAIGIITSLPIILWGSSAYSIDLKFDTSMLTPDMNGMLFGAPKDNVFGVIQAVEQWWEGLLPNDPNKPANHVQNAMLNIKLLANNIDGTGANPAQTPAINTQRPMNGQTTNMTINTAAAAINMMWWDPTPHTEEATEFTKIADGKFTAVKNGPADGKFDMLTVLKHETGHVIGFNDYVDFINYVTNTWNPKMTNQIDIPSSHFMGGMNLMTWGAGLPNGKSGRVLPQKEDLDVLEGAFGYMANRNFGHSVPEPSTVVGLLVLMGCGILSRNCKKSS